MTLVYQTPGNEIGFYSMQVGDVSSYMVHIGNNGHFNIPLKSLDGLVDPTVSSSEIMERLETVCGKDITEALARYNIPQTEMQIALLQLKISELRKN